MSRIMSITVIFFFKELSFYLHPDPKLQLSFLGLIRALHLLQYAELSPDIITGVSNDDKTCFMRIFTSAIAVLPTLYHDKG